MNSVEAEDIMHRKVIKLLSKEDNIRKTRRLAILLSVMFALWVYPQELGIFGNNPPANMYGIMLWASIITAIWSHNKLRFVQMLKYSLKHLSTIENI